MGKINTIKGTDIEKLNMNIDYYTIKKSIRSPQDREIRLFMNRYTIAALMEQEDFINFHSTTGRISKYHGYKVFQDDDLSFGEVEII